MGFDVLFGLIQQQFKLVLVVSAANMLEKRTPRSFILDYLYGSCSGCSLHLSDFQVRTHGEKIALVPILRKPEILTAIISIT
jgi:hypothetical protein